MPDASTPNGQGTITIDNHLHIIVQGLGGLGLFLLGMIVMTEGLRHVAGDAIRNALIRCTHSPLTGAITGAASTAVLQSSSATTVAAVGFVGAGLMSFSKALGIIFGANIGTTITGWLVALIGFKLELGTAVLPVIFVGAVLRLFANGRIAIAGYALAGFGLIFVGIDQMQAGMADLQGIISFDRLPADTFGGRLLLVGIGIIFTIITQSSSAGVATTLTALYSGMINFHQAASLVIGMDIGTTVTAAMATIGGSVGARRTGYSHVIYNVMTGVAAMGFIAPYTILWDLIAPNQLLVNAEFALVGFHTSFNTLGVIIVLPFTQHFARFIERIVPSKEPIFTEHLDGALLDHPAHALTAVHIAIIREFRLLLDHMTTLLTTPDHDDADLSELERAVNDTHDYVDRIVLPTADGADWKRLVAMIHALDHLQRLLERCVDDADRAIHIRTNPTLDDDRRLLLESTNTVIQTLGERPALAAANDARRIAAQIHERVRAERPRIIAAIGAGERDVPDGTMQLEALRWLRRVSRHVARISRHLEHATIVAGE